MGTTSRVTDGSPQIKVQATEASYTPAMTALFILNTMPDLFFVGNVNSGGGEMNPPRG